MTVLVVCGACGGKSRTPAKPDVRTDPGPPAQVGSGSAQPVSDALTEPDCDALLAHVVKVSVAERPADQQIDAAEMTRIQTEARPQFMAECRAYDRATYDCALAATATAAIAACR